MLMLGEKQEQNVEKNGLALQAGRDVHYHGMSVSEVKELCVLFLEKNFPVLRAEAIQAAQEHVKSFSATLQDALIANAADVVIDKFREPDVQAAINDAVQACARKGAAASPELLTKLISERISKDSNDYKNIVLNEAIQVVPRLTPNQISFLAFHHFVASVTIMGVKSISQVEPFARKVLTATENGFGLSASQKRHIEYTGAMTVNPLVGGDIYDALAKNAYKFLNYADGEKFKSALGYTAPSFGKLLARFNEENLLGTGLTSVGQAIAIAHLSKALGKLDYNIWLT
jgi:hypothetical protein